MFALDFVLLRLDYLIWFDFCNKSKIYRGTLLVIWPCWLFSMPARSCLKKNRHAGNVTTSSILMHKKKSRTLFLISKTHMHQEHSKTTQHSINHNRSIIKRILWLLSLDWNSTSTVVASEFTIHTTLALKVFSPLESSRVESSPRHRFQNQIK